MYGRKHSADGAEYDRPAVALGDVPRICSLAILAPERPVPSRVARLARFALAARFLAVVTLATTTAAVPAACARNPKPDPNAVPVPETGPTTVRVQNQGFADVTVYVYRGGSRSRLGFVTGNSTVVLTIPKAFVQPATQLRFLAAAVAGRRQPISEEVTVSPGDEVGLVIPPS